MFPPRMPGIELDGLALCPLGSGQIRRSCKEIAKMMEKIRFVRRHLNGLTRRFDDGLKQFGPAGLEQWLSPLYAPMDARDRV